MSKPSLSGAGVVLALFCGFCALLTPFAVAPRLSFWPAFVVFTLVVWGTVEIVVTSEIVYPVAKAVGRLPLIGPALYREEFEEGKKEGDANGLLACALCLGMWLGPAACALGFSLWPATSPSDLVAHGLLGAGIAYGIHKRM